MMKRWNLSLGILLALSLCSGCGKRLNDTEKLHRAAGAAKSGHWEQAEKDAREVLQHDPENISAGILQAIAYEKAGEKEKALDLSRQIAESAPENFIARYTYGRLLAAEPRRAREAFAVLEEAHRMKPEDRNTIILLCNTGLQSNHPRTADYLKKLDQKEVLAAFQAAAQQAAKDQQPDRIFEIARRLDATGLYPRESLLYYRRYLNPGVRGKKNPEYIRYAEQRVRKLTPPAPPQRRRR